MSAATSISWTDATWNPFTWRCAKVSTGCDHCYAETLTNRWQGAGAFTSEPPRLKEHRLLLPLLDPRMRQARLIFVASMSDPGHPAISLQDLARIWAVMAIDTAHTFQLLTKRPHVLRQRLSHPDFPALIGDALAEVAARLATRRPSPARQAIVQAADRVLADGPVFPLPNLWVGVSCEDQDAADARIPVLQTLSAATRFVSAEPLLGRVDLTRYLRQADGRPSIDWVITGGESGPRHRPLDLAWARDLRDQCRDHATGFWFKQVGGATHAAGGDLLDGRLEQQFPDTELFPAPILKGTNR